MGYSTSFEGKLCFDRPLDDDTKRVLDHLHKDARFGANPPDQPDSWCQWIVDSDAKHLLWDGQEKFYFYQEWLEYIIEKILRPRRYVLSGKLFCEGEEADIDTFYLIVTNNTITKQVFTTKDIAALRQQEEHTARKKVGEIIHESQGKDFTLGPYHIATLSDLLFKGIFHYSADARLFLVKEKDGTHSLYRIFPDELTNNTVSARTLASARHDSVSTIPIESITEIIHYTSPIMTRLVRSQQAYCICFSQEGLGQKTLFNFEDPTLITQITHILKSKHIKLMNYNSNDFSIFFFLLRKFIRAVILLGVTFVIFRLIFSAALAFYSVPGMLPPIIILLAGLLYYFIVYKRFIRIFNICFPLEIFRAKTVTNSIEFYIYKKNELARKKK